MAQPSGMKTIECPYCGQRYTRTNFMCRRDLGFDDEGRWIQDTHQAACWKRLKAAQAEIQGLRPGDRLQALKDLHEEHDLSMPRWFTKGRRYPVEFVDLLADRPSIDVMTDEGETTKLRAEHLAGNFRVVRTRDDL